MFPSKSTLNIKGLDGLRFIGTIIVLFFHIERRKQLLGIPSIGKYFVRSGLGQCAMTSFFVLSGFLIIYILLKEKNSTGTIDTKRFYKRRIARIWPLYYILIFISVLFINDNQWIVMMPHFAQVEDYYMALAVYLLHLPNFTVFFSTAILSLSHLWSLGVEEQFYVICPWIIKKPKKIIKIFILIIVFKVCLKILVGCSYRLLNLPDETVLFLKNFEHFLFMLRFEAFAIGGISAYLLIEKKDALLNFIYQPYIQRLNIFMLLITVPLGYLSESMHLLFSVNFGIIILNMAGNIKPVFMLDNKYTNYIGQISYGIYMYQIPLILVISSVFLPYYAEDQAVLWNVLYYSICIMLTFLVSFISYELIERRILNWARN